MSRAKPIGAGMSPPTLCITQRGASLKPQGMSHTPLRGDWPLHDPPSPPAPSLATISDNSHPPPPPPTLLTSSDVITLPGQHLNSVTTKVKYAIATHHLPGMSHAARYMPRTEPCGRARSEGPPWRKPITLNTAEAQVSLLEENIFPLLSMCTYADFQLREESGWLVV